jgi:peptidoglycan/LPS O-acetylase OafA/YrhL
MLATPPSGSPRRRESVQGLRAVAVVLVVLHHFFPRLLPGGYVGVDVFFVLSGYLVLSHVLRLTVAGERVRWTEFYYRRAQRILPVAVVTALLAYALALDPLMAR